METQYINLNMTPTGVTPTFHISQYDVGRVLGFMVYNGSEVVDLDTYTCKVEAERTDGTGITANVSTNDSVGTFSVTATMSNKADKYRGQLVITKNDQRIASLPFIMDVCKAGMDENAESIEEDASLYQQYTNAVQGAIAEANADIQAEEKARIAAVSAEAAARASADSNLQSQINQIVAPSGEAPSVAEVTDARIGADGIVYTSLGEANRTQFADLNLLIDKTNIVVSIGEHRGAFIDSFGHIESSAGTFAYSAPVPVYKGKEYSFTATGTTIIAAICSCDSSGNNRVVKYVYSSTGTEQEFTYIPTEDGYIVLSYNYSREYILISKDVVDESIKQYADKIKQYADKIDKIDNIIDNISESNENLVDFSDVVLGKSWNLSTVNDRAILTFDVSPLTEYVFKFPYNSNFFNVSAIEKTSPTSTRAVKITNIPNGVTLNLKTQLATSCICIQFASEQTVTAAMFQNYDAVVTQGDYDITAVDYVMRSERQWNGKRLVWLGTSIPAAGRYNVNNKSSYPLMVGQRLGATVYNEAVGSSALHCKDPNRINANNPYGFLANFEAVSRCITNSLEEMDWIIEHFNDANVFTTNVPASLSNDDKDFIRSCSWEVKLQKYFNASDFPDAWIIDHGHNDIPSVASEATYTAKESISGTQHNGYYTGGNFVSSTASSYLEFDVTNELYVWISGTFGSWYDIYDLFDADGNRIGYRQSASEAEVNDLKVNVANATTLRVSDINTLISTISVKKLTYPTYNSLYSYNGAFDFIVNKILTYNPRTRIIMIGEYENQKYPSISENQLIASQRWEFPLYKQWENLGWSQQPILVDGEYKSLLNIIIPDNLHPHTDTTGYALHQMANNIAMWLNTIA